MPSPTIGRGKRMASGRPCTASAVDGRAARVAEAEEAGHLVERLAGGVVDRATRAPVPPVALHQHEQRVPAGHEQHDERQLEVGRPRGAVA